MIIMIILKLILMVTGEAARTAPVKEGKSKELGVALANRFTFVTFVLTFGTIVIVIVLIVVIAVTVVIIIRKATLAQHCYIIIFVTIFVTILIVTIATVIEIMITITVIMITTTGQRLW